MTLKDKTALLIVGHSSTVNPDSSMPTWRHAREIRRRGISIRHACLYRLRSRASSALLFWDEGATIFSERGLPRGELLDCISFN